MKLNELTEDKKTLNPPSITVGDEVKVGKFKNRKAEVTGFTKDEKGQPVLKTTKGDQKLFKPRISKLEPKKVEETSDHAEGHIYQVGEIIRGTEFGTLEVVEVEHDTMLAKVVEPRIVGLSTRDDMWDKDVERQPVGTLIQVDLPAHGLAGIEEADTKIDVGLGAAEYKSVIKRLQDQEIAGKNKVTQLKNRVMAKWNKGTLSRKIVNKMLKGIDIQI